jgi:hypothetical protein
VRFSYPAPSFRHNVPFVIDPGFWQSQKSGKVNIRPDIGSRTRTGACDDIAAYFSYQQPPAVPRKR